MLLRSGGDGGNKKCAADDHLCKVPEAFAPRQPKEWSKRPNEWLTSVEIDQVLEQYAAACPHFHYTGFGFIDFAADMNTALPARKDFEPIHNNSAPAAATAMTDAQLAEAQPAAKNSSDCVQPKICGLELAKLVDENKVLVGTVLNISRHVEEGTHWVFVLLFLPPRTATTTMAPQMVYFDSTRAPPPPEIKAWHKKLQDECKQIYPSSTPALPLRVNTIARQQTDTECGMFALYAVVSVVQGQWLKDTPQTAAATCVVVDKIPSMLDQLLSKDLELTDNLVAQYRSVLFNRAAEKK